MLFLPGLRLSIELWRQALRCPNTVFPPSLLLFSVMPQGVKISGNVTFFRKPHYFQKHLAV
jgi:hypothetical protein